LLMASSVLERHRAVGNGFADCQMPLRDAGYRGTTLDAVDGRSVQVPARHARNSTPPGPGMRGGSLVLPGGF